MKTFTKKYNSLSDLKELSTTSNKLNIDKTLEIIKFLELERNSELDFVFQIENKISYKFYDININDYCPPQEVSELYFNNILTIESISQYDIDSHYEVQNYVILPYGTLLDVIEFYNEDIEIDSHKLNYADLYSGHIEWVDYENNKMLFAFNTVYFRCNILEDKIIFAHNDKFYVCFKKQNN